MGGFFKERDDSHFSFHGSFSLGFYLLFACDCLSPFSEETGLFFPPSPKTLSLQVELNT